MTSSLVDYGGKCEHYSWTQTKDDVTITVPIPKGTRARDIDCEIKPTTLKVQLKSSSTPIIKGKLIGTIIKDDSTWSIDGETMEIVLTKQEVSDEKKQWWKSVVEGEPEIDTELIEASKYLDESLIKKIKENKMQKAKEESEKLKENKQEEGK